MLTPPTKHTTNIMQQHVTEAGHFLFFEIQPVFLQTQMLNVWYIYLHLPPKLPKCR